jgi:hypothetical protein
MIGIDRGDAACVMRCVVLAEKPESRAEPGEGSRRSLLHRR